MKLIDKDALVAEIESKIEKYIKRGEESDAKRDGYGMYWGGVLSCLNELRTLCDALEVKEVELEKETKESWNERLDKDEEPVSKDCPIWLDELDTKLKSMSKEELQEVFKKYEKACNLKEESISEELETAAVEAFKQIVDSDKNNFLEIFKAGAQWQKQQMMKDAIEAEIINWASMFTSIKVIEPKRAETMIKEKFDIGDKVKLIIIKED